MLLQEDISRAKRAPSSSQIREAVQADQEDVGDEFRFDVTDFARSNVSFANSSNITSSVIHRIYRNYEDRTVAISNSERQIQIVTSSDDDSAEETEIRQTESNTVDNLVEKSTESVRRISHIELNRRNESSEKISECPDEPCNVVELNVNDLFELEEHQQLQSTELAENVSEFGDQDSQSTELEEHQKSQFTEKVENVADFGDRESQSIEIDFGIVENTTAEIAPISSTLSGTRVSLKEKRSSPSLDFCLLAPEIVSENSNIAPPTVLTYETDSEIEVFEISNDPGETIIVGTSSGSESSVSRRNSPALSKSTRNVLKTRKLNRDDGFPSDSDSLDYVYSRLDFEGVDAKRTCTEKITDNPAPGTHSSDSAVHTDSDSSFVFSKSREKDYKKKFLDLTADESVENEATDRDLEKLGAARSTSATGKPLRRRLYQAADSEESAVLGRSKSRVSKSKTKTGRKLPAPRTAQWVQESFGSSTIFKNSANENESRPSTDRKRRTDEVPTENDSKSRVRPAKSQKRADESCDIAELNVDDLFELEEHRESQSTEAAENVPEFGDQESQFTEITKNTPAEAAQILSSLSGTGVSVKEKRSSSSLDFHSSVSENLEIALHPSAHNSEIASRLTIVTRKTDSEIEVLEISNDPAETVIAGTSSASNLKVSRQNLPALSKSARNDLKTRKRSRDDEFPSDSASLGIYPSLNFDGFDPKRTSAGKIIDNPAPGRHSPDSAVHTDSNSSFVFSKSREKNYKKKFLGDLTADESIENEETDRDLQKLGAARSTSATGKPLRRRLYQAADFDRSPVLGRSKSCVSKNKTKTAGEVPATRTRKWVQENFGSSTSSRNSANENEFRPSTTRKRRADGVPTEKDLKSVVRKAKPQIVENKKEPKIMKLTQYKRHKILKDSNKINEIGRNFDEIEKCLPKSKFPRILLKLKDDSENEMLPITIRKEKTFSQVIDKSVDDDGFSDAVSSSGSSTLTSGLQRLSIDTIESSRFKNSDQCEGAGESNDESNIDDVGSTDESGSEINLDKVNLDYVEETLKRVIKSAEEKENETNENLRHSLDFDQDESKHFGPQTDSDESEAEIFQDRQHKHFSPLENSKKLPSCQKSEISRHQGDLKARSQNSLSLPEPSDASDTILSVDRRKEPPKSNRFGILDDDDEYASDELTFELSNSLSELNSRIGKKVQLVFKILKLNK